jgi:hypothetical protein
MAFATPKTAADILGKSVHIILSHLNYSGRLVAHNDFRGEIESVCATAIIVALQDRKVCYLKPDFRILGDSAESDFEVHVGCIGVGYMNDLTRCIYHRRETRRAWWTRSRSHDKFIPIV